MATNLVGMAAPQEVAQNVAAALEACGLVTPEDAAAEAAALADVRATLAGVQGMTWASGKF